MILKELLGEDTSVAVMWCQCSPNCTNLLLLLPSPEISDDGICYDQIPHDELDGLILALMKASLALKKRAAKG